MQPQMFLMRVVSSPRQLIGRADGRGRHFLVTFRLACTPAGPANTERDTDTDKLMRANKDGDTRMCLSVCRTIVIV